MLSLRMKNSLFIKIIILLILWGSSLFSSQDIKKVTLQLSWFHQFQFAGYYMAKEKGFYKEEQLDVYIKPHEWNINVPKDVSEGKADFGYNARTDVYENLYAAGIVDPTKVTRIAIENAASIASMLLTTECVIADSPEDESAMPMGGGMPGGGMPMM